MIDFKKLPLWVLLPNLVFAAYGLWQVSQDWMPDLFIYRAGSVLGWQHQSPYSAAVREMVTRQYPDDFDLQINCGYFLPPQAIVLFGPFAALPWDSARLLYLILCLVALAFCWYGTLTAFRSKTAVTLSDVPLLLPFLVLLHSVTRMTFDVGQTTILAAGAIVAGQLAWQADRKWLSTFLWSMAFVKPHIALPLLPLAWYLGGWRRAAMVIAWLAVLNLAACFLAGSSPLFVIDYLEHLGTAHKTVKFNLVKENPQIVSWNVLLYAIGGPAINLTIVQTLLGMSLFAALVVLRCVIAKSKPTPAWAVAVAITGGLVTCQVLAYEAFLLVLVIPHLMDCLDRGRKVDVYVITLLMLLQMPPANVMAKYGLVYYRPWLVMMIAIWLLARPLTPPDATAHSPRA
ncbi:hypothetical protein BH11PLA2_BH11PLA2_05500 [soil metagenome]